jgi:hypothetical protein
MGRSCMLCGSQEEVGWREPLTEEQIQMLHTLGIPVNDRRKGGQRLVCMSCKAAWCRTSDNEDAVHKYASEMAAGILVFSQRVFENAFVSVSDKETIAAANVAISDVFMNVKHGAPSHVLDRCTLIIHSDFMAWYLGKDIIRPVDLSRTSLLGSLLFGDIFVRHTANNATVVKYFMSGWGQHPLLPSDLLERPDEVKKCLGKAFDLAQQEETQNAEEQGMPLGRKRKPSEGYGTRAKPSCREGGNDREASMRNLVKVAQRYQEIDDNSWPLCGSRGNERTVAFIGKLIGAAGGLFLTVIARDWGTLVPRDEKGS